MTKCEKEASVVDSTEGRETAHFKYESLIAARYPLHLNPVKIYVLTYLIIDITYLSHKYGGN